MPVIERRYLGTSHFSQMGKKSPIQTMYARYQDIERIDLTDELKDALAHFIYWLMNKVGLIEISTDNDNYASRHLFEAMNDRGKPTEPRWTRLGIFVGGD